MLDNLAIADEKTKCIRNMVIQRNTENSMDGVSMQHGSLQENERTLRLRIRKR